MDKENILSQEKFYICLHERCDRKFRTLAGRSKHHRKCDKTLKEKEKGYNIVDGKKLKCKDCDKVSIVTLDLLENFNESKNFPLTHLLPCAVIPHKIKLPPTFLFFYLS